MTTERYQPPFLKRKFKIRHRSNPRYKMPFWYLIRVVQTHLHAKGVVVPMVGTIVYKTFSNYNELCTKYHITFYQFFSIKVVVLQQKESCFQIVSIMYWQYILISLRMRRLHLSLLYVGHCCITNRPNSSGVESWQFTFTNRKCLRLNCIVEAALSTQLRGPWSIPWGRLHCS